MYCTEKIQDPSTKLKLSRQTRHFSPLFLSCAVRISAERKRKEEEINLRVVQWGHHSHCDCKTKTD